ncbi:MAG: InlB B-repeat-containing protein [Clostridia bacterium]|nr:InlB B-repeat-containing protein [Clostridia bacterium]
MKFKRILAAVLSALMLVSVTAFTASAQETTLVYKLAANTATEGFSGEAVTGTRTYDAEKDLVYYHYVPKESNDWMHFGWHTASGRFEWTTPITVGLIVRTNKEGAVPAIRCCDRTGSNYFIEKKAPAIKGDGTWEIVWFDTITAQDAANVVKNDVPFDGLTHVQCFPMGTSIIGKDNLDSGLWFDVAGYAFFADTVENLADVDLFEVVNSKAPTIELTFDHNNGTGDKSSYTVQSGAYIPAKVQFPEAPEAPEGKIFAGWTTDLNAGAGVTDADVPAASTTYYAVWAQDESEPGDVTLKEIRLNGTLSKHFGLEDLSGETLTFKVPYNWNGDMVPALSVVANDATASVTVTAGTFGDGSQIKVKNGSAVVTYNVVYANNEASFKSYLPTGTVTSNKGQGTYTVDGVEYKVTGTQFSHFARIATEAKEGINARKLYYNTKAEVSFDGKDDAAKTIKNIHIFKIAAGNTAGLEGGGAYGFVTLSDYPWARVKYFIDAGEDGQTIERPFTISSTTWTNDATGKGYLETTKKNTAVPSEDNMVAGRWAYAYVNLAEAFAEDYGFTYQFHFRPYLDAHKSDAIMEVSADDPTVAVPKADSEFAVLFDDAFYLASVELWNDFPGTEDGKFEQIAPYAPNFTTADETELDANDGKIFGLTEGMEYSLKGEDSWTAYTEALAGEVTLAPGTYEIRYASYGNFDASPAIEVTIKSALAAQPVVETVNATAVDKNDGKITGVDSAMSYRVKGETEWTAVAADATEITGLAPAIYEVIYLADGEVRTEDSAITTAVVSVDFDTDIVAFVTSDPAYSDASVNDGTSLDKAFYVKAGNDFTEFLKKNIKGDMTSTIVIVGKVNLGGWNENTVTAVAKKVTFTGITSDSLLGFTCCNPDAANATTFSMINFGYSKETVFENITLDQNCLADPVALKSEHGIAIRSGNLTIADTVKVGPNSGRIRIYCAGDKVDSTLTLNNGMFEGVHGGVTYSTKIVTTGNFTTILDGASVHGIAATRHQTLWAGNYKAIVNSGIVRDRLYAGSIGGAFAGDAYVEINGGEVNELITTPYAQMQGNNTATTDYGTKHGSAVTVINGGKVNSIKKSIKLGNSHLESEPDGGSALIVSEKADIPALTGEEADYVITVAGAGKVEAVLEASDYTYQPVIYSRPTNNDNFTSSNQGSPVSYKASKITGFKVTIPEGCNAVKLNDMVVTLADDGILALDALEENAVNEIAFVATWILKADLNGGKVAIDLEEERHANIKKLFGEEGVALESDDEFVKALPGADFFIKPYRSGYTLAGWALTAEATAEECVEFPYEMTGDTTLYAIWAEANDTRATADDEALEGYDYFVYTNEASDVYEGFVPSADEDLGEIEYYGAFSVAVVDAATGAENTDAVFPIEIDISDIDLEGKLLYIENATDGGKYALASCTDEKCTIAEVGSGAVLQIYTLNPSALYELEGTYYAKRGEYTVDIYLDSAPVNAGSIGLGYSNMTYFGINAGENVQIIEATDAETAEENDFVFATWGVDSVASIGGDGRVHIATLSFTMNEQEREQFVADGFTVNGVGFDYEEEIFDGEYYLVAEHKVNELAVTYVPAIIADITDTVGPDAMVTVKGAVEMTARADGDTPNEGNYATIYWKHNGAAAYNKVVIEDADTDTAIVEFTLEDVPADTEIEIRIVKNGYLESISLYTFDEPAEGEEEKPERDAGTIGLVPGDIKGDFADDCGDGTINIADFVRVLRGFDTTATEEYRNVVDINEDDVVNVIDLGFVKANIEK